MASDVGSNQSSSNRPLSFQANMLQIQQQLKIIEEGSNLIAQVNTCTGSTVMGKILTERALTNAENAKNLVKLIPPDFDGSRRCLEIAKRAVRAVRALKTECR